MSFVFHLILLFIILMRSSSLSEGSMMERWRKSRDKRGMVTEDLSDVEPKTVLCPPHQVNRSFLHLLTPCEETFPL